MNIEDAKIHGHISDEEIYDFVQEFRELQAKSHDALVPQQQFVKNLLRKHSRRVRDHERRSIALFILKFSEGLVNEGVRLKMVRRILASYGGLPKPMRDTNTMLKDVDERMARYNKWSRGADEKSRS